MENGDVVSEMFAGVNRDLKRQSCTRQNKMMLSSTPELELLSNFEF